jgi:sarcosine oxidase
MARAEADVVVVGAGIMGAAAAAAVARGGRNVILLEQFDLGHDRGSSHGRSRIFRLSYPDPTYVRMAQEALPLWRRLEHETDAPVLQQLGGLDTGPGVDEHGRAMALCGVTFEWLDGAEVVRRFPSVGAQAGERFLFHPQAGIVRADRALAAFVRSVRQHGGEVLEGHRVVGLLPSDHGVDVRTEGRAFRARVAVVTAGAWARPLLVPAGIDLPVRPTRETVAYFRLEEGASVPSLIEWAEPAAYALRSPGQGIKAGEHQAGPDADPDDEARPSGPSVERLRRWIRRRFPGAESRPHLAETCLYTNTADQAFILERRGPIVVGSPCSGHGFKFAPVIGERLAALATDGRAVEHGRPTN